MSYKTLYLQLVAAIDDALTLIEAAKPSLRSCCCKMRSRAQKKRT